MVEPPAECDAGMRRDGIVAKPHYGMGERAWWLEQVLARTPLSAFTGGDPAAFLGLSIEDGWVTTVLRGLAQAAAAQGNAAWADSPARPHGAAAAGTRSRPPLVEALYAALDPDELVRRAIAAMGDAAAGRGRLIERMLEQCPAPWPDELARAVLAGFEAHVRQKRMPYDIYRTCRAAALRMPPGSRGRPPAPPTGSARTGRAMTPSTYSKRLATTLELRHDMIREIT